MLLCRNYSFMETKFLSNDFCFVLKNYSCDSEVSVQRKDRKFLQNILLSWGIINFHKKRRERTRLRGYLGATITGFQTAGLFEKARYTIRYF